MRDIIDASPRAAWLFARVTTLGSFRRDAPLTVQIVVWIAVIALVLLWPAGTIAYPGGWVFIVLFAAAGWAISFWLYRNNPRLLRERMASRRSVSDALI